MILLRMVVLLVCGGFWVACGKGAMWMFARPGGGRPWLARAAAAHSRYRACAAEWRRLDELLGRRA